MRQLLAARSCFTRTNVRDKKQKSEPFGSDLMVDNTRLLCISSAGPVSFRCALLPGASLIELRSRLFIDAKENSHTCGVAVSFGGRYKTRTCDLPHVKRMRYQLR